MKFPKTYKRDIPDEVLHSHLKAITVFANIALENEKNRADCITTIIEEANKCLKYLDKATKIKSSVCPCSMMDAFRGG